MRPAKLKTNYDHVTTERLPHLADDVVKLTTASTFWPDGATRSQAVKDKLAELLAAIAEAIYPSPSQTAQRDQLRAELRDALGELAGRLNLDFPGEEAALLSSGLELAEVPVQHKDGSEREPISDVELVNAKTGLYLLIRFKRPKGAVQVVCRYTTDAALDPKHWCVKFGGPREIQIGPFAEGTKVGATVGALFTETEEPEYAPVQWRYAQ